LTAINNGRVRAAHTAWMEYPVDLVRDHRLADGRAVRVRPARPEDQALDAAFLVDLSAESRRLRFPRWRDEPGEMARFHTHVDYERHMVLVCEAEGRIVGEAQYIANPGGRSCELGIVVADDWHHTGVAQLLMHALVDAARSRGFESLEGLVLRENAGMLDFVRTLGFRLDPVTEDGNLTRIVLPLTQIKAASAPGETM
jgi:acetyltransferase